MIINHVNKIIFIKTKKVGGTSFEIALSNFCKDNCVITPITKKDEEIRDDLGIRGPQNYIKTLWFEGENSHRPYYVTDGYFYNHIGLTEIKKLIPISIYENYLKVSITRSPYDVAISRYYWECGGSGMNFGDYIKQYPHHLLENKNISSNDGDYGIDYWIRYNNLKDDIINLENNKGMKGLWDLFRNIKSKSNYRPKHATEEMIYKKFPAAREIITEICSEEINKFEYL